MLRILFLITICIFNILKASTITYEKDFVKELVFNDDIRIGEIYISDPNVLNVQVMSKNKILLVADGIGRSVIRIKDKHGRVLLSSYIDVQLKISPLVKMINELYPNINISIKPYNNQVFLLGKVESPQLAKDLEMVSKNYFKGLQGENQPEIVVMNKLEIELPIQVMLKIKIVELSRDITKGFGIEWNTIGNGTGNEHGLSFGSIINGAIIKDLGNSSAEGLFDKFTQGVVTNWKYTKNGIKMDLSALLNVLEKESLATVLAEPTVVALSGEQATFSSGGKQSYPTAIIDQGGNVREGSQFADYGVNITFTPTVVSENLINIKLDQCKVTVPGQGGETNDRSIQTTVQMADGQTIAIAGLQKKDYTTAKTRDGFFANLPIIGDMFAPNQALSSNETELVITITPYIIRPSKEKLYYPVDGVESKGVVKNSVIKKFDKSSGITKDYDKDYIKPLEAR